jgi:hypothetical protein
LNTVAQVPIATGPVPTVPAALGHQLYGCRGPEFGSERVDRRVGSRLYPAAVRANPLKNATRAVRISIPTGNVETL